MIEIEKTLVIYQSDDGVEFTNKDNCLRYERELKNLKWFKVYHTPDLTEYGTLTNYDYFVVYSECGCHEEILTQYMMFELSFVLVGPSVQGYRLQKHLNIVEVEKDFKNEMIKNLKYTLLTSKDLIYFCPKTDKKMIFFNYAEKWNLRF